MASPGGARDAFAAAVLAGTGVGVLPPADVAILQLLLLDGRFDPHPAAASRHATGC
jgi:hypothetical protein